MPLLQLRFMIDSPDEGGTFQYITKGRDYENNFIDKKSYSKSNKRK